MELFVNMDRSGIETRLFKSARGEIGRVEIWENWFEVKSGVTLMEPQETSSSALLCSPLDTQEDRDILIEVSSCKGRKIWRIIKFLSLSSGWFNWNHCKYLGSDGRYPPGPSLAQPPCTLYT